MLYGVCKWESSVCGEILVLLLGGLGELHAVRCGCRLSNGVAPRETVAELDGVCRLQDLPDAH